MSKNWIDINKISEYSVKSQMIQTINALCLWKYGIKIIRYTV